MTTAQLTPPATPSTAIETISPTALLKRFELTQQIAKEVMIRDIDYGLIPGCGDKPALFKPGAEALCAAFLIVPRLEVETKDLPAGHREYSVVCTLLHAPTGTYLGQGVGTCTTMESKYRYRGTQVEPTGLPLPKGYWEMHPGQREKALASAAGAASGREFTHKKIDGAWQIVRKTAEKAENTDPADQFNTVLKMAKKRALVDAVLTATAASRLFSQDLEDMEEMIANTPKWVDATAVAPPPEKRLPRTNDAGPGSDTGIPVPAEFWQLSRVSSEQAAKCLRDAVPAEYRGDSLFPARSGGGKQTIWRRATTPVPSTPPADPWTQAIRAFGDFGVTEADMVAYLDKPAEAVDLDDLALLRKTHAELRSGAKQPGDFFPRLAATAPPPEVIAARDALKSLVAKCPEPLVALQMLKSHGIPDIDSCADLGALTASAAEFSGYLAGK